MDKTGKETSERSATPAVLSDDENEPVCEKAFTPETSRGWDEDEPCKDGVG